MRRCRLDTYLVSKTAHACAVRLLGHVKLKVDLHGYAGLGFDGCDGTLLLRGHLLLLLWHALLRV